MTTADLPFCASFLSEQQVWGSVVWLQERECSVVTGQLLWIDIWVQMLRCVVMLGLNLSGSPFLV